MEPAASRRRRSPWWLATRWSSVSSTTCAPESTTARESPRFATVRSHPTCIEIHDYNQAMIVRIKRLECPHRRPLTSLMSALTDLYAEACLHATIPAIPLRMREHPYPSIHFAAVVVSFLVKSYWHLDLIRISAWSPVVKRLKHLFNHWGIFAWGYVDHVKLHL